MTTAIAVECCPPFDPDLWDGKTFTWDQKLFVKDHVRSIFHIPLNFGSVMKRSVSRIVAAAAKPEHMMVLSDENSPWGSDVYLEVNKSVAGAEMTTLSGTYMTKVFEGPYRNAPKWMREMKSHVRSAGKKPKKIYFYYTTCPKCAKKYGRNFVVLFAEI